MRIECNRNIKARRTNRLYTKNKDFILNKSQQKQYRNMGRPFENGKKNEWYKRLKRP
jgi:hypothetical protein